MSENNNQDDNKTPPTETKTEAKTTNTPPKKDYKKLLRTIESQFRKLQDTFDNNIMMEIDVADKEKKLRQFKIDFAKLKDRVKSIYDDEENTENVGLQALRTVLNYQRAVKLQVDKSEDYYLLNKLELEVATEKCQYYHLLPGGRYHHLELGEEYFYKKTVNEEKATYTMSVFAEKIKTGEEQIDKNLERKINRGFQPTESDYADDKVLIDRIVLSQKEWRKYFRHVE